MAAQEPTFTRPRPNALLRLVFRLPPLIYHGPIAKGLASRCVIRLTATGRNSGLPRTLCLSAMQVEGGYVVFSGFGIESNWYQNLLAHPQASIRVGGQTHKVVAEVVQYPESRRNLMIRMRDQSGSCGPPQFIRPLLRLTRAFDYDAELEMAVEHGRELPVVMLRVKNDR